MTNEIQISKDFVEGKLSDKDFEQQLYTNPVMEELLSDPTIHWHGTYLQDTTPFLYMVEQNYRTLDGRLKAQGATQLFLTKIGIGATPST